MNTYRLLPAAKPSISLLDDLEDFKLEIGKAIQSKNIEDVKYEIYQYENGNLFKLIGFDQYHRLQLCDNINVVDSDNQRDKSLLSTDSFLLSKQTNGLLSCLKYYPSRNPSLRPKEVYINYHPLTEVGIPLREKDPYQLTFKKYWDDLSQLESFLEEISHDMNIVKSEVDGFIIEKLTLRKQELESR